MQGGPVVSIVTPSLNMGVFIEETISSVLDQDYPHVQYLVLDGGSTDGTLEILKRYEGRLTYVSESDSGQADAVNKGFQRTQGSIFTFLNADDTLLPGAITAVVEAFSRHPDAGVVYGNAWHLDEDGTRIAPYPVEEYDASRLSRRCFICQPAAFIRRDAFAEAGMLDASLHYALDYDFWIRLARLYPMKKIEPFLATSRIHRNSKTVGQMRPAMQETIRTLQRHYGYVPCNWLYGYCHHMLTGQCLAYEAPKLSALSASLAIALGARYNWRSPARYWRDIVHTTREGMSLVMGA
jgi:glycosyltransferase involved in cell wall biosynthesis